MVFADHNNNILEFLATKPKYLHLEEKLWWLHNCLYCIGPVIMDMKSGYYWVSGIWLRYSFYII